MGGPPFSRNTPIFFCKCCQNVGFSNICKSRRIIRERRSPPSRFPRNTHIFFANVAKTKVLAIFFGSKCHFPYKTNGKSTILALKASLGLLKSQSMLLKSKYTVGLLNRNVTETEIYCKPVSIQLDDGLFKKNMDHFFFVLFGIL